MDKCLDPRQMRLRLVQVLEKSRRGHVGAALSLIEILSVLYGEVLRFDPGRPDWVDRDRFILSKGHGVLALYIALAELGFFPQEELETFCDFGSRLGGHPEYGLPGIEAATGALGHGLSIGVGMALAGRIDRKDYRTIVLVGDGECQEGSVWEAALAAGKHQLDSLTVIVDHNRMQCYGTLEEVQPLEPLADKFLSFGFAVEECDGHDVDALKAQMAELPFTAGKPSVLICKTRKGMGFESTVDNPDWHHKSRLSDEELQMLYSDLEAKA
jgi:transketolase